MSLLDVFRYDGKRALVVGGASGIGAATAELVQAAGADVVVMDFAPVPLAGVEAIHIDLAEAASIDTAVNECRGKVDALFACAGVAENTPDIEKINFIGHRHLIDRLLQRDMLSKGSAIAFISSVAGLGWETHLPEHLELFATPDFDAAVRWAEEHGKADYFSSKQAICAYVASQALPLLKRGIRINALSPGPTDTPLARANKDVWLGFGSDYRSEAGIEPFRPIEQAYVLAFLCSDAAAAISGVTLVADAGYWSSGITGSFPAATPFVNILRTA